MFLTIPTFSRYLSCDLSLKRLISPQPLTGCLQDVVASLASDKNVWDAVMKNEKVMKFYKTYESRKH
jgi:hypothetical protein